MPKRSRLAPSKEINRLIEIMCALRDPGSGCPWDIEQTFSSIAPYTIEEAYEVAEAIHHGDMAALADELGDLLLQVVYHAQMAAELGAFDFADVVYAIAEKMIRRHPHVFGDRTAREAGMVAGMWEKIKANEKHGRGKSPASAVEGVPAALPALTRALKLQKKAARVGFDWDDPRQVLAKLREEIDEIEAELDRDAGREAVSEELGDLLFAVANLARHLAVDPEAALRAGNSKFERRFRAMEARLALSGRTPEACSLDELEAEWQAAKAAEKA
jgi:MazG family protein